MPDTAAARPLAPYRRQQGSAYIIALLALVVLTILGLSLSVVTQSELVIGANERVEKRTFYAADSGIDHSLARALVNGDYEAADVELPDPGSKLNATFTVSMSPLFPVAYPPCNLCEINNRGNYANDRSFSAADFAVTSQAVRRHSSVGGPLAQKTISSMLQVQPMQLTTDALGTIGDEEQLERLKF